MIHDRLPRENKPDPDSERGRGWRVYTFPCSCGAMGPWRSEPDEALADWYDHELAASIREHDGVAS